MPRVPFSLQPVLSYKESLVDLLERQLAQLLGRRHRLEQEMAALEDERQRLLVELAGERRGRMHLDRLALYQTYLEWLGEEIVIVRERLAALEREIEAKREELLAAMQDKEMLEKLREKVTARFLAELERQEADLQDEMATTRFVRAGAEARSIP